MRQWATKGAIRTMALWPQYGPQSACHQALPIVHERMPRRMPNWKMRANALVEGSPTTRPWRMPSFGSGLNDAHHPHDRSRGHEAVGIERDGEFVLSAPALAEVPEISSLEAGVGGAAAIGHRNAAPPLRGERSEAGFFERRDVALAGVAQNVEMESTRPRPPASISRIMASRFGSRGPAARCARRS